MSDAVYEANDNDIAIIGMAIRVPDANTPEEFWQNLKSGRESVREYSDDELLQRGIKRSTLANPSYVKAGIPLQDIDQFDPEFFGFSQKEAGIIDPQHRHFYEASWEAIERAGHPPSEFDGAIGVFAGCGMGAYFVYNLLTNSELLDSVGTFLLRHTGNDKDFLSTRVSYLFDLKGPSVNVQTACSTSLVATHMAVQSLLSGECDLALAGGSTIEVPHEVGYTYKEGEVLSPDGHCRPFDHRSKGTVFGSGAGVIVLRRLNEALEDGDHIHAVIKGSAINNDGSSKVGYLAPSVEGQSAAVAEALAVADVDASTIEYVECHGTATPVGDPIEIAALTSAFRETTERTNYCRIGSVKSNIGHLDTAAGVASLIKATLALENRQIPPSLNFEAPNPNIEFEGGPFEVASKLSDWPPADHPRRACVNSLGVGGTNAFVVLEEAPSNELVASSQKNTAEFLTLSARNKKALDDASSNLLSWLRRHPDTDLSTVSYTLSEGRKKFEHRRVFGCKSVSDAIQVLEENDPRRIFNVSDEVRNPRIVFMFPGGGAQYFQMGQELYAYDITFRENVDRGLSILHTKYGADLRGIFLADASAEEGVTNLLDQPSNQLPLIFIIEYALVQVWKRYGVEPDLMIGHSMGENTAACVAGVTSYEDALGILLLRGQLVEEAPPGGVLSVPMPADDLKPYLRGELDLASANSPQVSVASGTPDALDNLARRLSEDGIDSQRVKVNVAAHSRLFDGILQRFGEHIGSLELSAPSIPIVSNRTGQTLTPDQATDPRYWMEHLRHTVFFGAGIDFLAQSDDLIFLEVGPGNMLGSFARQNGSIPAQRVVASMRHPNDNTPDDVYLSGAVGKLKALGADLDTGQVWSESKIVPLPTYPFQHASYWFDPGVGNVSDHEDRLKPMRIEDEDAWYFEPLWIQQGILKNDPTPKRWLALHGTDPITTSVIERLRINGHEVIEVLDGDVYAKLDDQTFSVAPEAGGDGYQQLIETLRDEDRLPDRILHSWLLTFDQSHRPGSTFFHRIQNQGFYSLFYLARAFGKAGLEDHRCHWLVVANGSQSVRAETIAFPTKATAIGPCRVIPREFRSISCAFVDLDCATDDETSKSQAVSALIEETNSTPDNRTVAWRGEVRWQHHVRDREAPATSKPLLKVQGTYLVTGGLGGIATTLCRHLADTYNAKLLLTGRTPIPAREEWDSWLALNDADDPISASILKIRELEQRGSEVLYQAADVTVAEHLSDAIAAAETQFGRIDGVFHAAGTIRDSLIQLKTTAEIEEVFSTKLYGTLVLDDLFRDHPLDFMLLFGSTSTYVAPQGQIDYVAANSFLNAFAASRKGVRPYPVSVLNWGIWSDVGMVAPAMQPEASASAEIGHRSYREGTDEIHEVTVAYSAAEDWVIDEHRLKSGEALLPGTGYFELIQKAVEASIGSPATKVENLIFQNGLFVEDGASRLVKVRLKPRGHGWHVDVLAQLETGWETCATAQALVTPVEVPDPLDLDHIRSTCKFAEETAAGAGSLRTRQEDHLQFGPRWRVLKNLRLGKAEALAHLELPDDYIDDLKDHSIHPALLDIGTGCAMDLIPGYSEQDIAEYLWVPFSYTSFTSFAPFEPSMHCWIRYSGEDQADQFAVFDVSIVSDEGRVLAEVGQLTLNKLVGEFSRQRVSLDVSGETEPQASGNLSQGEIALQHNVSQGITGESGVGALEHLLNDALPAQVLVSSLKIDELLDQAEYIAEAANSRTTTTFDRPQLDTEFESPRDDIERTLAELWAKLLGVDGVGIHDSFFDLGGHSLVAVRLFNEISDNFGADMPMSVLMQSPTICDLATLIRGAEFDESADTSTTAERPSVLGPRYTYIVPMNTGPVGSDTPLFMVAGMFGNVLNLSHLALLLGEDRPFYALQARGLFGEMEPHESFEDMARDYIEEIRQVQPEGPYLLGGFSGGGLIAYEIARQLISSGETVHPIIMLDTPVRDQVFLSLSDRLSMAYQDFRRTGPRYFIEKLKERSEWQQVAQEREDRADAEANSNEANFKSETVGNAFLRALRKYKVPTVDVDICLFRPKQHIKYHLSGGRMMDEHREYLSEDNGWTPFVRHLDLNIVPGDHDSMVLEPNVRVLVGGIKAALQKMESQVEAPAISAG